MRANVQGAPYATAASPASCYSPMVLPDTISMKNLDVMDNENVGAAALLCSLFATNRLRAGVGIFWFASAARSTAACAAER
jgi:hypothetical protein